jgi:hypothetical protein
MKTNILGTTETLRLYNKAGKAIYEFDTDYTDPDSWDETTFDGKGRVLTVIHSTGYWCKYTRDSYGKELTYENSYEERRGFDIPEFTMEQLVEKLGINFKLIK